MIWLDYMDMDMIGYNLDIIQVSHYAFSNGTGMDLVISQ